MNFEKKKEKHSKSFSVVSILVIAAFLVLFGLLGLAFARSHQSKDFLITSADVFTGREAIYAVSEGETVILNDNNIRAMAKTLTAGTSFFVTGKDVPTGQQVLIYSISDTGHVDSILLEELQNGKTMATVTTENNTVRVSLKDSRFVSFKRLCSKDSPNGENTVVESTP